MRNKNLFTIKNMALIAILSALAAVLMAYDFPVPFAPPFYKIDFSEVPILIGGFAISPVAGIVIEGLKVLLRMLLVPTSTAYVGELANFIIGVSFVFPAAVIYHKYKSKKSALLGLLAGSISMIVVGALFNYYVLIPAYSVFFHMDIEAIIGLGTAIMPVIKDQFTFVVFATSTFNLFKAVVISAIVAAIYKHISRLIKKF